MKRYKNLIWISVTKVWPKFYPSCWGGVCEPFQGEAGKPLTGRRNMDAKGIYRYCRLFTSPLICISCELLCEQAGSPLFSALLPPNSRFVENSSATFLRERFSRQLRPVNLESISSVSKIPRAPLSLFCARHNLDL